MNGIKSGLHTSAFNKDASPVGRIPNKIGHGISLKNGTGDQNRYSYGANKMAHINYEENWQPTEKEIFFGTDMEKDAAVVAPAPAPGFRSNFNAGFGLAAGGLLAAAIGTGVQRMMQRSEDRSNMLRFEESLRTAMQMSPTLQRHSFNELRGYLPMIAKASPTVAGEPRLLANYLETMIDAEGNLNLATFGEIASLESNLLKNQATRNELSNAVILEGVKGISKGGTEGLIKQIGRR